MSSVAGCLDGGAGGLEVGHVELERVAVDLAGDPLGALVSMSPTQTSAPSAASRAAIAAPIPLAPPVTRAFRPSSLIAAGA